MGKYLPDAWERKIGSDSICDELLGALFGISDIDAELNYSWELIQIRMQHPDGALTFEAADGHLILVPGSISHQGVGMFMDGDIFGLAAYYTPFDFGLESYPGQIFFPLFGAADREWAENFVGSYLADSPGSKGPKFDIVLEPAGVYSLKDDTFLETPESFADAMDALDTGLTSQEDKDRLEQYAGIVMQTLYFNSPKSLE